MSILVISLIGLISSSIFVSIYIFHNLFLEFFPFSFENGKKKLCFFLCAYFGLFVFVSLWAVFFYLFYLIFDFLFSLQFIFFISFFIFVLFFILFLAVFFIEALNYQFMISSYWKEENFFFFFISRSFGILFFWHSFLFLLYLLYFSVFNFILGYYSGVMLSITFFIVYSFWLISFIAHFLFHKSFFIV